MATSPAHPERPLLVAGLVLGAGLGGFLDGILFHQVLQWHHLLTSHPDPAVAGNARLNVLADGLFHIATWLLTALGLVLLVRALRQGHARSPARTLGGAGLAGAGLFVVVEGLVDHQLLGIHHVHPSGALLWDLGYLAVGALLLAGGWAMARASARVAQDARPADSGLR